MPIVKNGVNGKIQGYTWHCPVSKFKNFIISTDENEQNEK